jgi:hypothetical protein
MYFTCTSIGLQCTLHRRVLYVLSMYSIVLYVLRRGRMYSNEFRCTLLCFWSTCTPYVLRVYSSGTLSRVRRAQNTHWNHKSPRIQSVTPMWYSHGPSRIHCTLAVLWVYFRSTTWSTWSTARVHVMCGVQRGVRGVHVEYKWEYKEYTNNNKRRQNNNKRSASLLEHPGCLF